MSEPLWRRLSSSVGSDAEVAEIVSSPVLHAEARQMAPALRKLAEPCGPEAALAALRPLVLVYGIQEAARSAHFWRPYMEVLGSVPLEALSLAISEYIAKPDSAFFPKPGPLKAIADRQAEPIRRAAHRATTAARMEARHERAPPTEQQRAAVAKQAAEAVAALSKPKVFAMPQVNPPATHGKADETGLTPQMKALMEQRRGEGE